MSQCRILEYDRCTKHSTLIPYSVIEVPSPAADTMLRRQFGVSHDFQ